MGSGNDIFGVLPFEARKCVLSNLNLDSTAKILLTWKDSSLEELLRQVSPELQWGYLMEGDFISFLTEKNPDRMVKYDCIIDNGLLLQTGVDVQLLRAMGMHLLPGGKIRSIFDTSVVKRDLLYIAYSNNFEQTRCVAVKEVAGSSFYAVEFALFNQGIAWLQSFYSPEVRKKLAYFLQRLDFCIEVDRTAAEIVALCRQHGITSEYLSVMLELSVIHKQCVRHILASCKLL